jgi:hypothetical protein
MLIVVVQAASIETLFLFSEKNIIFKNQGWQFRRKNAQFNFPFIWTSWNTPSSKSARRLKTASRAPKLSLCLFKMQQSMPYYFHFSLSWQKQIACWIILISGHRICGQTAKLMFSGQCIFVAPFCFLSRPQHSTVVLISELLFVIKNDCFSCCVYCGCCKSHLGNITLSVKRTFCYGCVCRGKIKQLSNWGSASVVTLKG